MRSLWTGLLLSLLMLAGALSCAASSGKLPAAIHPEPQHWLIKEKGQPFRLEGAWSIVLCPPSEKENRDERETAAYRFCAQVLQEHLAQAGLDLAVVDDARKGVGGKRIFLGNPFAHEKLAGICERHQIDWGQVPYSEDDPRYGESYILDLKADAGEGGGIVIAAPGAAGLFYGVQSVIQLVKHSPTLKPLRITDYPDMKWRGCYVDFRSFRGNDGKPVGARLDAAAVKNITAAVQTYAAQKINTVVFAGQPLDQLDGENPIHLKEIFDACRRHFINPIPTVNSLLWGKAVKDFDRTLANHVEGVWIQNEKMIMGQDGYLQPLHPPASILPNGGFEADQDGDGTPDGWVLTQQAGGNGWQPAPVDPENQAMTKAGFGKRAAKLYLNQPRNFSRLALETQISCEDNPQLAPGDYYELSFWSYSPDTPFPSGKVIVEQMDASGGPIGAARIHYGFDFFSSWHGIKNWLPVFVHPDCRQLKISFIAFNSGARHGNMFIDNVELFRMGGALLNVIDADRGQITVKDEQGGRSYEEGSDYKIEAAPFHLNPRQAMADLKPTRIRVVPRAQIQTGQTVRVSYDCLVMNPRHRNSRLCPSSLGTYSFYRESFEKLIALGTDCINIHMSEHQGGFNRDSRCLERNLSNAEQLAAFVLNLNNLLHASGDVAVLPGKRLKGLGHPEVRLFMWDDMVNYWHNGGREKGHNYYIPYGGKPGATYLSLPQTPLPEDAIDGPAVSSIRIPSDVILAVWWYANKDPLGILKNSPGFYGARGFDFVGVSWDRQENIQAWSRALEGSGALGLLASTWNNRKEGIGLAAEYAWKSVSKR